MSDHLDIKAGSSLIVHSDIIYYESARASYPPSSIQSIRINAFVVDPRDRKLISTSSPKQFTEKDIEVIIRENSKNHSPAQWWTIR